MIVADSFKSAETTEVGNGNYPILLRENLRRKHFWKDIETEIKEAVYY